MQASLEKKANSRKRSKLLTRSARLLFENIPRYVPTNVQRSVIFFFFLV